MTIALIGFGNWGRHHQRILQDLGHTIETFDIDDDLYDIHPDRHDGAVIAASTVNHWPIARNLIEAGLPVYVEKPVLITNTHYTELSLLTPETPFMAGHQLLFHPDVQRLQESCVAMASYRTGSVPRTEGAVLSLAVHDIAVMCHVFEDSAAIQHIYAEGHPHTSMVTFGNPGSKAYASIYAASVATARMRHTWFMKNDGNIVTITPDNWNRLDLLQAALAHFIDHCVTNGEAPLYNNVHDTLNVMRLALQADQAVRNAQ